MPLGLERAWNPFFRSRNYPLPRSLICRSASHIADRPELLVLIHEKQDLCRIEPSERQRSWPVLQLASAPRHDCLGLQCDRKNYYRAPYWTKSRCSGKGRYRRFGVRSSASRFQTPAMAWECSVSARPSQGSVRALCQAEGPSFLPRNTQSPTGPPRIRRRRALR